MTFTARTGEGLKVIFALPAADRGEKDNATTDETIATATEAFANRDNSNFFDFTAGV
jgi:hypothetical protein